VVSVLHDSPAEEGGIRCLDILLEIEHRPIYSVYDAKQIINKAGVGKDLEVKILRATQEMTLHVKTTDFVSLWKKQYTKKFPEMQKSLAKPETPNGDGAPSKESYSSSGQEETGMSRLLV